MPPHDPKKKPTSKSKAAGYAVGYGKPPEKHQYKKGQSGNAGGRPKKQVSLHELWAQAIAKQIVLRNGDKTVEMSRIEALIESTINDALRGERHARRLVFAAAEQLVIVGERPATLDEMLDDWIAQHPEQPSQAGSEG